MIEEVFETLRRVGQVSNTDDFSREWLGMEESYQAFQGFFNRYGFAAILAIGILPIPFQVAMITAGLSGYPILLFVLAALLWLLLLTRSPSEPDGVEAGRGRPAPSALARSSCSCRHRRRP